MIIGVDDTCGGYRYLDRVEATDRHESLGIENWCGG